MTKGSNCHKRFWRIPVFSSEIIDAKQKVLQRIFSNNKLCEEPNAYNLNDLFFFLLWRDFRGEWTKRQISIKGVAKNLYSNEIKYKTEINQFTSTLTLLWREIYVYGN